MRFASFNPKAGVVKRRQSARVQAGRQQDEALSGKAPVGEAFPDPAVGDLDVVY